MPEPTSTPEGGKKRKMPAFMASKALQSPGAPANSASLQSPTRGECFETVVAKPKPKRLKQSTLPLLPRSRQQAISTAAQPRPDCQLMLGVPDKALVQACKAILQQADAAKHDLQVLSCQHSQQLLKADGLQEQQSGSDSAGAPTTLPAGKTIPAAMTVCASASAAAVQSPCNQDPDSDEATNRVESQQHDDQDCSIAERGQSGGLSNSGMLDVVSQTVQPGPTARHMPKQSTLLDAMLEDKADLHSSLAVSSSCLPDAADTTAQPFDVGSPHQPPEQAPKRNTSRIDSLLDAMLA